MKVNLAEILDKREKSPSLEEKMLQLLEDAILNIEGIEKSHSSGEIDDGEYYSLIKAAVVKLEMIQQEILEYDEVNDTTLIPPPYNKVMINGVDYHLSPQDCHFLYGVK